MIIKGIHHLSAHTANAFKDYDIYTRGLSMRLVKQTVNQGSPAMYHLVYGDEEGNTVTELAFYENPMMAATHTGTNSVANTFLRVTSDASLQYWQDRFQEYGITAG